MESSESSCLLPSFLSEAVKVKLHLQSNSVGSPPFLAWSRISYHQSFTSVRSTQRLNKIGISCSFSPTPRDFLLFFFRDWEKQKQQLQIWACLKGSICFSKSYFQGLGKACGGKLNQPLNSHLPWSCPSFPSTRTFSGRHIQAFCPPQINQN